MIKVNKATKLSKYRLTLIHRETRDGFGANNFHSEYDGVVKTLTIVKTTNGNIFGCYTDLPWNQPFYITDYIDNNPFIFSLVNEKNQPFIEMPNNKVSRISFRLPRDQCLSHQGVQSGVESFQADGDGQAA